MSDPTSTPDAGPFAKTESAEETKSIVDTILDLDELLSADVRRAEKTARFTTKPHLEGEIEALEYQLSQLVDGDGNVLADPPDSSLADGSNETRVRQLLEEIRAKKDELRESMRSVRVAQLSDDEWTAFRNKHKDVWGKDEPLPPETWDDLISQCAIAPQMTLGQVQALRKKIGAPAMDVIAAACFAVCTQGGVSVPKSLLSSTVLKRLGPEKN